VILAVLALAAAGLVRRRAAIAPAE
jgi:hypothetical protein